MLFSIMSMTDYSSRQHKLKIVRYPDSGTGRGQGVGRKYDYSVASCPISDTLQS